MHAQQDHPWRALLESRFQPSESVVGVAERCVEGRDTPRRHNARRARLDQLGEPPPCFGLITHCDFQMRQTNRRSRDTATELDSFLVRRARLVETAERFQRSAESAMRAVETGIEADGEAIMNHRLLVLAREEVSVTDSNVNHHRLRILSHRFRHRFQRLSVPLVRLESKADQVLRVREAWIELDGLSQM